MRTFDHIGVPTTEHKEGATYAEGMKLWLTDYEQSPNRIEWLRFESDSWMPEVLKKYPHVAYQVSDPKAEMEGKNVILPPTELGEGKWIAFIEEEGVGVELMWKE